MRYILNTQTQIKIKALGLILNDKNEIFVTESYDTFKHDYYYRCPGGTVEFGELTEDTLKREFLEELNEEIDKCKLFHIIENIFI